MKHKTMLMGSTLAIASALFASATMAGALSDKDKHFVEKAAIGGMAEVEQGQLASQKASNADVRKFGDTMIGDHSKANDKLKALAQSKGWNLPNTLDAETKNKVELLRRKDGTEFDEAYVDAMRKDHDEDVALFEDEAAKADDPALRQFAQETLPTLKHHKQMAYDLKPAPAKR